MAGPGPEGAVPARPAAPVVPGWTGWLAAGVGLGALVVAAALAPAHSAAAAGQDWPPFVLVTGLLLLGLVAGGDGLFAAAGSAVARLARRGPLLLGLAAGLVAVVTAVLNLDTAVAFLTPVLVVAARRRGADERPFLYLAVFLANGASLLLPGSNLTNLIVLGQHHQAGAAFAATMALPWVASCVAVTAVVAVAFARRLRPGDDLPAPDVRPTLGIGLAGVVVAVAAVVALPPGPGAIVVLGAGVAAVAARLRSGGLTGRNVTATVHVPVLAGLFGLAVALGAAGRSWDWPARLLDHASSWQAAVVGGAGAVAVNNLPAASLLAARPTPDPYALLIGLNLGPNLAVTGSLAVLLWFQAARSVGARASARRFSLLGLAVVPTSMAAALAALHLVR